MTQTTVPQFPQASIDPEASIAPETADRSRSAGRATLKTRITVVFLGLSGLLLLFIGGGILLVPHAFHAGNGIALGADPSLLSEVRAPGGLLVASALFLICGSFKAALRLDALRLAVMVYGSFGLARLVALAVDGVPSAGLLGSTAIELIVAALGLALLSGGSKSLAETTRAAG